jgi:phosphate transport system substrate-binding protein
MLQKMMEDKKLVAPPKEDIAAGMGDIIERTANYRNYMR